MLGISRKVRWIAQVQRYSSNVIESLYEMQDVCTFTYRASTIEVLHARIAAHKHIYENIIPRESRFPEFFKNFIFFFRVKLTTLLRILRSILYSVTIQQQ